MKWNKIIKIWVETSEIEVFVNYTKVKKYVIKWLSQNQILITIFDAIPESIIINLAKDFVQKRPFSQDNLSILDTIKWLDIENNLLYFIGKKYSFKIIKMKKTHFLYANNFVVDIKNSWDLEKAISKAIIEKFCQYMIKRTNFWITKMGIEQSYLVKINKKKTSWATNYNKSKIHYSTALIPFDQDVLDYVIIHELSHHFVSQHNKLFWEKVANFCLNYKEMESKLNKNEYK
ncbi:HYPOTHETICAL PROTEIN MCJ_001740 [Mesomycoplasma conjunctivae]|uniref:YgjP-like metallopeptidase domain-containing protein n=1 Tax=Mesomycoplasma conjunctivae (strain ATCC 25834 / NCTC 10147 / HRC/581) TaxID=572263 RepID=C5J5X5_MESCH|nr:YgjP-like metallopeptidase domain-containing protein [Mesomycoplasma conjunctivae]CAT04867.1 HYPOTHETICAL PROTEIN MCJ_001740 [Mesomycoplasma conjunctivae]